MTITPELIEQHQLTPAEYQKIVTLLGREPSYTELGVFSVMWSEHCSYKSSRIHLKKLPTQGKYVVQGPGENAGIIGIGGGWVVAFKIESHNHPSYIEPFQGAATGVGGILRDIFTMGARPIAVMDSLRFGPLRSSERRPQPAHPRRRGQRHRALRQLFRRSHRRRRMHFRRVLFGESAGQRFRARRLQRERNFLRARFRHRQSRHLRRREDRPRRHPRRFDGQRRVHRGIEAEAPQRSGGRSVPRKASARSLPRSHEDRRHRRHSGHGRGRAHFVLLRNGQPRRRRHRHRSRSRPAARIRHDGLRNAALGIPGAHAAGGRKGPRRRGFPACSASGASMPSPSAW